MSDNSSFALAPLTKVSAEYLEWMNDVRVREYLESRFGSFSEDDLDLYIKQCAHNANISLLGIFVGSVHIGNIKLNIDPRHWHADVGIVIGCKKYWGKGYGKKAVEQIKITAQDKGLHKIYCGIHGNNLASLALFKSCGFSHAGRLKEHYLHKGKYVDKMWMEYLIDAQ